MNVIDRAISWVAPRAALKRVAARALLDAGGKRFEAAKAGREDGWMPLGTSADPTSEVVQANYELRRAARQLEQDDPFAVRALAAWTCNAAPIAGRAQVPGIDRADAKEVHDPIDTLWWQQCQRLGADGETTADALMAQVVHAMVRDGEILARRIDRPSDFGLPLPFQVQLLEAEFLDESRDRGIEGGGAIVGGIQFNRRGQREGYWLHREHPGQNRAFTRQGLESVFVSAEQIAHIYEPLTYGLQRGFSWFAPVIMTAKDLGDYNRAERKRKMIQACFAAFVHGFEGEPDQTIGPTVTDSQGKTIESIYPGMIAYVRGLGGQVQFGDPKATGGYAEYMRVHQHAYAAGLHLTYELLTGDLSQVNFSSARVGLLEFRRRVRHIQKTVLIPRYCERIWSWFLMYGQALGKVRPGTVWAQWSPPRWEAIQPLEDAQATELQLGTGTLSPQEALAREGIDWLEYLDDIEQWNAELDKRGIAFGVETRKAVKFPPAPAAPATPPVRLVA
jgi:lambda family phage portal protein